ncbi:hypothetical protein [Actinopolymorpha pittospori]|uniref:Uncharacterized protein n=1 Tax=Actinopolymorpha pittospori TaxID=648752 RepID=A0A927N0Y6_9ACTN|nr:hypothetical protein [Actinopolymorpha pittospori]MBE1606942.1 hypothetical protein [Actinopolymorpha pittospori]
MSGVGEVEEIADAAKQELFADTDSRAGGRARLHAPDWFAALLDRQIGGLLSSLRTDCTGSSARYGCLWNQTDTYSSPLTSSTPVEEKSDALTDALGRAGRSCGLVSGRYPDSPAPAWLL